MPTVDQKCNHGITFDKQAATKLLENWMPSDIVDFVMGNPQAGVVRELWPRLNGKCPKGCGYVGIYCASPAHYTMGDW